MALAFTTTHTGDHFESLGEFLTSVLRHGEGHAPDPRLHIDGAAGGDEHHGASVESGSVTVPVELARRILRVEQSDDVLGGLTRLPMTSSRLAIPARVDKDHSKSVAGGITLSRRPQTLAIESSRVELEQVGLNAITLAGLAYVAEELLADSREAIARLLEISFTDAVRGALINELIRGTGTGEMMGVLSSPALITVSKEGGQSADTITGNNIRALALQTWDYDRAVWLANPDTRSQLVAAHIALTNTDRALYESPSGETIRVCVCSDVRYSSPNTRARLATWAT